MSAWKRETIRVAIGATIERREGWTYGGLGLICSWPTRTIIVWTIIHLNSGHGIAQVQGGALDLMKEMTAEIADAGDWSFDGLNGFENQFPDAAARVNEIVLKHRPDLRRRATPGYAPNAVVASAIALSREDERHGG